MSHAELTDEQVEELRRAVEAYDDVNDAPDGNLWALSVGLELTDMLYNYRHEILASLGQLQAMRRRMKKGVG